MFEILMKLQFVIFTYNTSFKIILEEKNSEKLRLRPQHIMVQLWRDDFLCHILCDKISKIFLKWLVLQCIEKQRCYLKPFPQSHLVVCSLICCCFQTISLLIIYIVLFQYSNICTILYKYTTLTRAGRILIFSSGLNCKFSETFYLLSNC